jgi:Putative Actinobacterial Holin-X, holin superfamily III
MSDNHVVWPEDPGRGLRQVAADIWRDGSLLFEQHAALAAKEVAERTSGLWLDLAASLGAVALLQAGVLALLASASLALHAAGFAAWQSTLIVAVLAATTSLCLALWARARLVRRTTARSETVLALSETSDWLEASLRGDYR